MTKMTKKDQRRAIVRLLSYTKSHSKEFIIAFSRLILATIGDIIGPIIIKVFIDEYLRPRNLPVEPLVYLGALYLFIHVTKVILQYFQLVKFQEIALKIIREMRVEVFSKVHKLGLKYFDKTPGGSIVSRVTNDTEAIKDMFVEVVATFVQNGVLLIGIFIAMFYLNVQLALVCLLLIPILFVLMQTYRKFSSRYYHDMRERLSQLNAKLNESLQGM